MSAEGGPVAHRAGEALGDNRTVLRSNIDRRALDWPKHAVAAETRLKQMSAIYQGGICHQQLNRRHLDLIAFANRFARKAIALSRRVVCFALEPRAVSRFTGAQRSGCIVNGHGRLAKPERPQGLNQLVAAQTLTERREVVIARVRN